MLRNEKNGVSRRSNGANTRTLGGCSTGGEQVDLGERVLGVLARAAAAGEERLQRLRGELDDAVAVDPPGPAALELGAPSG